MWQFKICLRKNHVLPVIQIIIRQKRIGNAQIISIIPGIKKTFLCFCAEIKLEGGLVDFLFKFKNASSSKMWLFAIFVHPYIWIDEICIRAIHRSCIAPVVIKLIVITKP